MKKLMLIRHAKASQNSDYKDFERPLKSSGREDAVIMAERLNTRNIIPQVIVSSPALRAESTANIFAEHLILPKPQTDMLIYDAKRGDVLKVINNFPNEYDFIALAGHNPDMSQTIYDMTGQHKDVPTCTVALIEFDIDDWKLVSSNTGTLAYYDEP